MKFSDKLQKIRKENNITQEGLADKLNVSRQAVSKWESGSAYPDTEKLILISKIFNVKIDDLINDGTVMDNVNKKLDFMGIFNQVLDFISKSVNMFWSMKFSEKIRCLFEMGVLILIIIIFSILSNFVVINILRRVLMFLPGEFVYFVCGLFEMLLLLVWIVIGIVIVLKIFKSRYLDYYVFVIDGSINERVVEEPIKELRENREYRVVIRDPKDSSLNIFKRLGNILMFFVKCLCFVMLLPLVLIFIFSMIVLVFSLFYMLDGIFFNGISIAIVGGLLFIYLVLEFIYNVIFNREHMLSKIFIIFIISISLIGIGIGLTFVALSTFSFEENIIKDRNIYNIDMSDNLVLYPMIYDVGNNNLIIDNSLDKIKLEIISYGEIDTYLYSYDSYNKDSGSFKVMELSFTYNDINLYKDVINNLVNERIVSYDKSYEIKMYVSEDNLTKLRENINKYADNVYFE